MPGNKQSCDWCAEDREIVYVDPLEIAWCQICYDDIYDANF